MPSTISVSVTRFLASSTVITPSLPTFCIALAISSPMNWSPFAEILPIWAISSFEETFLECFFRCATIASTARSTPRFRIHRVQPRRHRLGALARDRGREHGRRGGAVAGVVMLFRGDFAHELRAEVLEPVGKFDLLGDGHAVLGDARRPERLFDDDIATLRPKRDLHRVIEDFDAVQDAIARIRREADVFGSHFLHLPKKKTRCRARGSADDAHDVAFLHDEQNPRRRS